MLGQRIRMLHRARSTLPGLQESVDAAPDADGEQRRPAVGVERDEGGPQVPSLAGQLCLPVIVPLDQRSARYRVVQPRCEGSEADALRLDLEAGLGRAAVEGPEHQGVQQGEQGRVRVGRQRRSERQGTVGRELRHQPIGQASAIVLLLVVRLG